MLFGGLICVSFTVFTRWLHYKGKINQAEWNVSTITAGDYSIELPIKKKAYKRWLKEVYEQSSDRQNGVATGLSFKKYLIN